MPPFTPVSLSPSSVTPEDTKMVQDALEHLHSLVTPEQDLSGACHQADNVSSECTSLQAEFSKLWPLYEVDAGAAPPKSPTDPLIVAGS